MLSYPDRTIWELHTLIVRCVCLLCDSLSAEMALPLDESMKAIFIALPILVVILLGILSGITCIMCVLLKRCSHSRLKRQLSAHNTMYKMALNSPGIKPDPLEFPRSQLVMEETLGMLYCVKTNHKMIWRYNTIRSNGADTHIIHSRQWQVWSCNESSSSRHCTRPASSECCGSKDYKERWGELGFWSHSGGTVPSHFFSVLRRTTSYNCRVQLCIWSSVLF